VPLINDPSRYIISEGVETEDEVLVDAKEEEGELGHHIPRPKRSNQQDSLIDITLPDPTGAIRKECLTSADKKSLDGGSLCNVGLEVDSCINTTRTPKLQPLGICSISHAFPVPSALQFEKALTEIIGQPTVDAIRAGQTVEIKLPWSPSDGVQSSIGDIVTSQMDMYSKLGLAHGVTIHYVHTALQLATRQDLLLWLLAAWLFEEYEVITLPIPALNRPLLGKRLSGFTASVSRQSIDVLGCNVHWKQLKTLSNQDLSTISQANASGGALIQIENGYQLIDFEDDRAALFVHPHPICRALIGAERWQSPLVKMHIEELLDTTRTATAMSSYGRLMFTLMIHSATRSVQLDHRLRQGTSSGVTAQASDATVALDRPFDDQRLLSIQNYLLDDESRGSANSTPPILATANTNQQITPNRSCHSNLHFPNSVEVSWRVLDGKRHSEEIATSVHQRKRNKRA